MKKRTLSVLLAIALLVGMLPVSILSASAYSETDIPYAVEGGNIYFDKETGVITDCDDSVTAANIPGEIDGVSVTSIGDRAFYSCENLTSVTIPDSVTIIEAWAFAHCHCLTSVTIPDSVMSITGYVFYDCGSLTSVTIPDSVTSIGIHAFHDCDSLTSMTIPDSVTSIEVSAFYSCDSLTGIWVEEANEYYSNDENGVLFNKDKTTLIQCPGGYEGSYAIPDSVEYIDVHAFAQCHSLTSATIPNSVRTINLYAFSYCSNLTSVTISDSVVYIGFSAFYGCNSLSAVYFLGDAPTLDEEVFYGYDIETDSSQPIPGLTLYYTQGAEGWTTPTWNGYPTALWNPDGFVDVSADAWYADAVEYAVENGLFNGMSATTFEPETAMTRAMLVTVLWRYAGEPMEGENTFTDVPDGQWYTDAVAWAAHNNIVGGVGDNKFDPNGNVTREQMATILYRYTSGQGIDTSARADLSSFPDAGSVSGYANDPLCWAVAEGLINGSDGKLLPQGNATRAQVATILMRFIENVVK